MPLHGVIACTAAVVAVFLMAFTANALAVSSNVTVTAVVPSATNLSTAGCATGTPNVTSFGTVLPASTNVTSSDCSVVFGSSNDSSMLRVWQEDGVGSAMTLGTLLAGWHFDGNGNETSGLGNAAVVAGGAPTWVTGHLGQAVQMNGTTDYMSAPSTASQDLTTYTVEAWIKVNAVMPTGGSHNIIVNKGSSGTNRDFGLGIWAPSIADGNTGHAICVASASGVALSTLKATAAVDDGAWHHVACEVDGVAHMRKVFVDGVLAGSAAYAGTIDVASGSPVNFGHSSGADWFNGVIDEVRITGAAASTAPVADFAPAVADWGTGSNMFGVCLRSVQGGASTDVTTWTADTVNANCTDGNADPWKPVVATSGTAGSKIAASTVSGTQTAQANLRFGFRASNSQAPGTYSAPLVFEVLAPNV